MGDRSVGDIVVERLGRPVVDRLVDPLIGGIHAGGVYDLSAAATFPALIAASHQPGASCVGWVGSDHRRSTTTEGLEVAPAFWSLAGTTASLADRLPGALERNGVPTSTPAHGSTPSTGSARHGGAWSRSRAMVSGPAPMGSTDATDGTDSERALDQRSADRPRHSGSPANGLGTLVVDGVVIAVPAGEAARAPRSPTPREAAGMLSIIDYASVAVVTLSLPDRFLRCTSERNRLSGPPHFGRR